MHNKPRRKPQMGFTLGYRFLHLPPGQWLEVLDEEGRELGLHRDVEGFFRHQLTQAAARQLQVTGANPAEQGWLAAQPDQFQELARKLAQHQQAVAKARGAAPANLRYHWRAEGGRTHLTLG